MSDPDQLKGSPTGLLGSLVFVFPVLVLLVAVAGFLVGVDLAPDLADPEVRSRYEVFLEASAAVVVGLFVVFAVDARHYTDRLILACATVIAIALAVLGSTLSLLPDLPDSLYPYLFGALTGGGLAALVSVGGISIRALSTFREGERVRRHGESGGQKATTETETDP